MMCAVIRLFSVDFKIIRLITVNYWLLTIFELGTSKLHAIIASPILNSCLLISHFHSNFILITLFTHFPFGICLSSNL